MSILLVKISVVETCKMQPHLLPLHSYPLADVCGFVSTVAVQCLCLGSLDVVTQFQTNINIQIPWCQRVSSTSSSDTVIACLAIFSLSESRNSGFGLTFTALIGTKLLFIAWISNEVISPILPVLYCLQHQKYASHEQYLKRLPWVFPALSYFFMLRLKATVVTSLGDLGLSVLLGQWGKGFCLVTDLFTLHRVVPLIFSTFIEQIC